MHSGKVFQLGPYSLQRSDNTGMFSALKGWTWTKDLFIVLELLSSKSGSLRC